LSLWFLGLALGLSLTRMEVALAFIVMVGISIFPVSVGGWGVREIAVVAFLSAQGVASEDALLFSVCYGIVLIAATLPGAVAWLVVRPLSYDPATDPKT
jgi:uncharacterized membrane protein YbhN (UPF0104 family)